MTRLDFYVLQQHTNEDRMRFAARLCEKAYQQQMTVMILTSTPTLVDEINELLWQFKPESFIPHSTLSTTEANEDKVLITCGTDNIHHHGLLINLGLEVPEMFSRFERVAEIVVQTPEVLAATRNHYSFYRERGYPIESHKISAT